MHQYYFCGFFDRVLDKVSIFWVKLGSTIICMAFVVDSITITLDVSTFFVIMMSWKLL